MRWRTGCVTRWIRAKRPCDRGDSGVTARARPQDVLRDGTRQGNGTGRGRGLVRPVSRRDPGDRRRIGVRENRHLAVDPAADSRASRPHPPRQPDRIRGPEPPRAPRTGAARRPRQPDRDDLSGADDLAESGLHRRGPDRGGRHHPSASVAPRRAHARDRDAAAGRYSRARGTRRSLSASALGRHAPARHDRDGARLSPESADRRRADHRARRDDPGADPRAPRPAPARAGHGGAPDHARSRRGRGSRRPRRRHVRGPRRRNGADGRAVRASHASVYRGAARGRAAHRHTPSPRAAARDPRSGAGRDRLADRLPVPPALSSCLGQMPHRAAAARERHSRTHRALLARHRAGTPAGQAMTLVDVRQLVKHYAGARTWFGLGRAQPPVRAVDGVSFSIASGRTLGLVGESGSGKTTVGRTMLRLQEPTAGKVLFEENDVFALDPARLRALRRRMQIVFQDPYSSLNPRMTVEETLREPLQIHGLRGEVAALLDEVGLDAAFAKRYPHELSGGQRQRVGIERALSVEPQFIVCDEPVSALDVSVRAQVLNLLADLQAKRRLTYLFIAHDLAVVRHIADDVAVMYLGKIVERAPAAGIYAQPRHPYSRALLLPVPSALPASQEIGALPHRGAGAPAHRARPPRSLSLRRGADVTAAGLLVLAQTLTNLAVLPAGAGLPSGWKLSRMQGVDSPGYEVTRLHTLRVTAIGQGATALHAADLKRREGDDSPIRVVITFRDGRTIAYAWGNREGRGESFASWAGRNRMVVVLQRAEDADGSWHEERRDPFSDYRRLWNSAPKPIVSVGVSSDSDGLKIRAAAEIADLTWHAPQ